MSQWPAGPPLQHASSSSARLVRQRTAQLKAHKCGTAWVQCVVCWQQECWGAPETLLPPARTHSPPRTHTGTARPYPSCHAHSRPQGRTTCSCPSATWATVSSRAECWGAALSMPCPAGRLGPCQHATAVDRPKTLTDADAAGELAALAVADHACQQRGFALHSACEGGCVCSPGALDAQHASAGGRGAAARHIQRVFVWVGQACRAAGQHLLYQSTTRARCPAVSTRLHSPSIRGVLMSTAYPASVGTSTVLLLGASRVGGELQVRS
jgi:hypothetical protein